MPSHLSTVMTAEVRAPASTYRNAAYTTSAAVYNPGYFDAVDFDPGHHLALYNGTYNYLVPATGYYLAMARFASNTAGTRIFAGICLSNSVGSAVTELSRGRDVTTSYQPQGVQVTSIEYCAAGTYITAAAYTNVSVGLYVGDGSQFLSIVRVA